MLGSAKRRNIILDTLIKGHIYSNAPLSSTYLVEITGLNISSSTMRNDLALLEKKGYIQHLHTSSGRVPTDNGYRYYVNNLMEISDLASQDKVSLSMTIQEMSSSTSQLLEITATLLSQLTQYPVIVISESNNRNIVRFIKLLLLSADEILAIILNEYGESEQEFIRIENHRIKPEELNKISEQLNRMLSGKPIKNITENIDAEFKKMIYSLPKYKQLLENIVASIKRNSTKLLASNCQVKDYERLMDYPEFQEIKSLQKITNILTDESKLIQVLSEANDVHAIQAHIGSENQFEELQPTSIVWSKINIGQEHIADVGVIGPKRMRYSDVFGKINFLIDQVKQKIHL